MRKALLGIAVLAGAAVAVFIAAVLSVYYVQEKRPVPDIIRCTILMQSVVFLAKPGIF